jgi:DNA polymerase I-like protein with 3'-5' exonuclease and polymerase domains
MHTETAMRIFGVKSEDVTEGQRFLAKRVTFGIAYGVSGIGLATQLRMMGREGWDAETCDRVIREWLKLYAGCAKYFADVEREVSKTGEVRDCWGMRRYLPAVWSSDLKSAAEAKRQAVNHRIQGGAQGMIQNSMAYLRPLVRRWQNAGLNVRWTLQVHDAILLRLDEELVEFVEPQVREALCEHARIRLRVPVEAKSKTARSWGEL